MDDSNDSQALAIKLLHTFDLEINTSRKIPNDVLFMVPEQTGQKLLARAHRILNQETDHVGNVCPKVSFTAHDRELIISNGSLVHHICQIDTLLIPSYRSSAGRMTSGERRLAQRYQVGKSGGQVLPHPSKTSPTKRRSRSCCK